MKYIIIALMVLSILIGCTEKEQIDQLTPENTFEIYMKAVNNDDTGMMNKIATQNFQEYLADNVWDFRAIGISEIGYRINEITYSENKPSTDAIIHYTALLKFSDRVEEGPMTAMLKKIDGKWYIDDLMQDSK